MECKTAMVVEERQDCEGMGGNESGCTRLCTRTRVVGHLGVGEGSESGG